MAIKEGREQTRASERFRRSFANDLTFKGEHACLEPLQLSHLEDLNQAAADGELWELKVTSVPTPELMAEYVQNALAKREQGRELPFVIRRNRDQKIVGSTRYYFINAGHRNVSIGYTWYSASAQRTLINSECKLMLLQHAFEVAGAISVQWHTHHENTRSQAAILRLGAKFEGVLRNAQILPDGRIRHTHCFSMLDDEWPASKQFLAERLRHYTSA